VFVTQPPEKVTFSGEKMTFTFLKVVFTILKVTFSDEKVTLFGNKVVFSQQFSREFNRKVYLLGKACQASIAKDHLFLANGHLSAAYCHSSAFNYIKRRYSSTARRGKSARLCRLPKARTVPIV
jgi:hypothetical protein